MSTLFQPLPQSITQSIARPVATTVRPQAQQMRARNSILSPQDHADALSSIQDYLDGLQGSLLDVQNYLQSLSVTTVPITDVTAPNDVVSLSVSGTVSAASGFGELIVSIVPPASGPFSGCHLYLEIPDQSASPAFVVGSSTVGGADAVTGQWAPLDLQRQPYVASQQPWLVSFALPDGIDLTAPVSCRIYAASYAVIENALVRAGTVGETPNAVFTLTPETPSAPASGTTVSQLLGPIVATALTPDNSSGKLRTPVYVIISSVPTGITGWVGRLIITYGSANPTIAANQFPVGPVFNTAGPVYATNDGIAVQHSFAVDTPNTIQSATVWAVTGLVDASGNYQWNNIVPGVTPSFPITLGTTTGTVDAGSVMLATIQASMAVVSGQFGVAVGGISNPLIASLAVDAGKLANSAVTAVKIANLAVGTAAIQLLAVNNTLIANATITSTQIAAATIVGANIASATIVDANIANLSASKITAGTIAATISITSPNINGGAITGATMVLTANGITTTMNNLTNPLGYPASLLSDDGSFASFISPTTVLVGPHGLTDYMASLGHIAGTAGVLDLQDTSTGDALRITPNFISIHGNVGFTGTLAAAIAGSKNVIGGIIY